MEAGLKAIGQGSFQNSTLLGRLPSKNRCNSSQTLSSTFFHGKIVVSFLQKKLLGAVKAGLKAIGQGCFQNSTLLGRLPSKERCNSSQTLSSTFFSRKNSCEFFADKAVGSCESGTEGYRTRQLSEFYPTWPLAFQEPL